MWNDNHYIKYMSGLSKLVCLLKYDNMFNEKQIIKRKYHVAPT